MNTASFQKGLFLTFLLREFTIGFVTDLKISGINFASGIPRTIFTTLHHYHPINLLLSPCMGTLLYYSIATMHVNRPNCKIIV